MNDQNLTEALKLLDDFNEQSFSPDDVDGTVESGPDFHFPLYRLTGKRDGDWIEVHREGRGVLDPEVGWIRRGETHIESRDLPGDDVPF